MKFLLQLMGMLYSELSLPMRGYERMWSSGSGDFFGVISPHEGL